LASQLLQPGGEGIGRDVFNEKIGKDAEQESGGVAAKGSASGK